MTILDVYRNYSIKEILEQVREDSKLPVIRYLYEQIVEYKNKMEKCIETDYVRLQEQAPDNAMRWIYENVKVSIRPYVIMKMQKQEYNVLMKNAHKWKTIADIGIPIIEIPKKEVNYEDWKNEWKESAIRMKDCGIPFFETHAHYNLKSYDKVRERLLMDLYTTGVKQCILPSIEFESIYHMKQCFDAPEYEFIRYGFGSHPKYIYREEWTKERWREFSSLLDDPKCVALGEVGLDYSYKEFNEDTRKLQMELFAQFIQLANKKGMPMILHIRPSDVEQYHYDVNEDAMQILKSNQIRYGAVLHCFGGTIDDVKKYLESGVTHFGIGGRIVSRDSEQLEKAIMYMPESSILLETDAPYMKIRKEKLPNTSFALVDIAEKIARIKGNSVSHIIRISYENANKLFFQFRK